MNSIDYQKLANLKIADFLAADDCQQLIDFIPSTREEFLQHMQLVYNLKLHTRFPLIVHIEPTNFCNQRCRMCQHPSMKRPAMHMDDVLAYKAIDECIEGKMVWFIHFFFFGEPFINRNIFNYLRYTHSKGFFNTSVTTNFSMVSEHEIEEIVDSGLKSIHISFEGLDRGTFLRIRRKDQYEKVRRNIEKLIDIRNKKKSTAPWISLTYVRTDETDAQIRKFENEWQSKVNGLHISPQFDYLGRSELSTQNFKANSGRILSLNYDLRLPCRQLWLRIAILSNGEMTPCSQNMDGELSLGNIRDLTIHEAWTGKKLTELRKQHLSGRFSDECICKDCIDWDWSGKVDKRPEICKTEK